MNSCFKKDEKDWSKMYILSMCAALENVWLEYKSQCPGGTTLSDSFCIKLVLCISTQYNIHHDCVLVCLSFPLHSSVSEPEDSGHDGYIGSASPVPTASITLPNLCQSPWHFRTEMHRWTHTAKNYDGTCKTRLHKDCKLPAPSLFVSQSYLTVLFVCADVSFLCIYPKPAATKDTYSCN